MLDHYLKLAKEVSEKKDVILYFDESQLDLMGETSGRCISTVFMSASLILYFPYQIFPLKSLWWDVQTLKKTLTIPSSQKSGKVLLLKPSSLSRNPQFIFLDVL